MVGRRQRMISEKRGYHWATVDGRRCLVELLKDTKGAYTLYCDGVTITHDRVSEWGEHVGDRWEGPHFKVERPLRDRRLWPEEPGHYWIEVEVYFSYVNDPWRLVEVRNGRAYPVDSLRCLEQDRIRGWGPRVESPRELARGA